MLRSRWLFGPEFESEEFFSNATLQTVAERLFGSSTAKFSNPRNRPNIVALPDGTTVQLTGVESFDFADSTLVLMQHVLPIEHKKGGLQLTRKEINQADGYVEAMAEPLLSIEALATHVRRNNSAPARWRFLLRNVGDAFYQPLPQRS